MVKINFIQRKSFKEKIWKALNVVVGVTTIVNVSMVGTLFVAAPVAEAADTTWLNPSANFSFGGVSSNPSDPDQAYSENDDHAVFDDDDHRIYGGFNISIPAGATVRGIEVKVRAKKLSGGSDKDFEIFLSENGGATWGIGSDSNQNTGDFGSSYSAKTVGGSSGNSHAMWGRLNWTASELSNTNFRVRLSNDYSDGSVGVDHVAVKVSYGGYAFMLDSPTPPTSSDTFTWTLSGQKPGQNEISHVTIGGCWDKDDIDQQGSSASDGTLVFNNDGTVKIDNLQDNVLPTTLTLSFNQSFPSSGTTAATVKAGNGTLPELTANGPNCNENGAPPPTPLPNPPLGQSCGLDIGLIIDRSGSMDSMSNEVTPMRNALTSFVDAFAGTPTQMSVVEFATTASVLQPFTSNLTAVKTAITDELDTLGSGTTNWEDAVHEGFGTFDPRPAKPNLMVVATDGSPNTYNTGGGTNFSWTNGLALNQAIEQANTVKSAGTRIVVIGIGQDEDDPDFDSGNPAWNNPKLSAISGPTIAPPNAVDATTDVIKTDFDQLGSSMSQLANALCGGKILVQKMFDTNGDGQPDLDGSTADPLLSGWTFDVNGGPSDPGPEITTNTGALEFDVLNGTYSITETNLKEGTRLIDAWCVKEEQDPGVFDPQTRTISGLEMDTDDTISCTFVNGYTYGSLKVTKVVSGGAADPDDFGFRLVGSGGAYIYPASGEDTVVFENLRTGQYSVEETGPSGYHQTNASCNNVQVVAGEQATCTMTNVLDTADLTVTKTDGLTTAQPGQQLTYTMVISNIGEFDADNVTVADTLPAQVTYVSSTLDGVNAPATVTPNASGDQLSWTIGTLASGASKTLLVTVALDATFPLGTTVLHNMVTVSTTSPEPNTENNSASDDTSVSAAPILGLQKSATPTTVAAGENITWTVKWSVTGNAQATNITIVDPIPANSTFVSVADGGVYDAVNNKITWSLGTQSPGASGEVHYVAKAASPIANGTVITNTATIDSSETDPPVSASASVTVTSAPDLTITKVSDVQTFTNPGKAITYTVTVTNKATATDTAKNVILTDTLPAGFTFAVDGSTTRSFVIGNLAPGQSATVSYLVNISGTQTDGTYENLAKAKGDNTAEVTAKAPVEVRVPQVLAAVTNPNLTITKSVNQTSVKPGNIVTYTITVKNTGDADATNVVITDLLPKNLSFVHSKGQTKTWDIGTLEAGRTRTVDVDVRIDTNAKNGDYVNTATVTADELPQKDAKATVTVKKPKVLGLATTGVGTVDYAIAILGLTLVLLGTLGVTRRQTVKI